MDARLTLRGEGATRFDVDATGPGELAVSTVSAGCRPDMLIGAQCGPPPAASWSSKVGRNVEEAARVERVLHKRPDVRRCVHADAEGPPGVRDDHVQLASKSDASSSRRAYEHGVGRALEPV